MSYCCNRRFIIHKACFHSTFLIDSTSWKANFVQFLVEMTSIQYSTGSSHCNQSTITSSFISSKILQIERRNTKDLWFAPMWSNQVQLKWNVDICLKIFTDFLITSAHTTIPKVISAKLMIAIPCLVKKETFIDTKKSTTTYKNEIRKTL